MPSTMPARDVIRILEARVILEQHNLELSIGSVYCSDLMSDILSYSKDDSLLITGLINPQIVRTAEMVEIALICFVHHKLPQEETLELARENRIPLVSTRFSMYEACGRLYAAGLGRENGG
ncbi:MAG: DRTGG domain-containing protein [Spirochaetota bacterium]